MLIVPDYFSDPGFINLIAIALVFIGPCLGSFASAIAYRSPRGISWIADKGQGARSACPHCGYKLRLLDLVPILSWLFLRGKCRNCQARVSRLYPALEIAALIFSLLLLHRFGVGLPLLQGLFALPFVLALIVIAWQGYTLPRQLSIIIASIGVLSLLVQFCLQPALILQIVAGPFAGACVYALLGAGSYFLRTRIFKKPGDTGAIWFLAAAGIWLGIQLLPAFLIVAGGGGILMGMARGFLKMQPIYIMPAAYTLSFLVILVFGVQIMALLLR